LLSECNCQQGLKELFPLISGQESRQADKYAESR
jgi:hypothetical protein